MLDFDFIIVKMYFSFDILKLINLDRGFAMLLCHYCGVHRGSGIVFLYDGRFGVPV